MENTRKKSCSQCRAAKTGCNLATPNCMRCERRNLSCSYEQQRRNGTNNNGTPYNTWLLGTRSQTQTSLPRPTSQRNQSVDFMSGSDRISELFDFDVQPDMIEDDSMLQIDMDWNNGQNVNGTLSETRDVPDIPREPRDADHVPRPQESDRTNHIQTSTPMTPVAPKTNVDEVSRLACAMMDSPQWDAVKWQAKHGFIQTSATFLQRRHEPNLGARLTGNMMWTAFKRYATEFSEEKLPPFIHQIHLTKVLQECGNERIRLPEILGNCSTVISMYQRKNASNSNLVNKTLLLEIKRLFEEFHHYGERDILHASQVAAFYLLLLAADDDRSNVVGTVVRIAMGEISFKLGKSYYVKPTRDVEAFPAWRDWAFAESEKRTMVMLHLLNMILDCNISSSGDYSCSEILDLPLPANKASWEASSKLEWEKAYRNYLSRRKRHQQLTIGDVRRSRDLNVQDLDQDLAEDMENWASEADDFGTMALTGILAID
ncbi:hypothetical protein BJ875DRAFT_72715 [Amylocarpus encephaloides]|uniref:Zn(2)-C6 fungal-type domain-containing protein n=1 Tax=Amylocarpus encephaloides TaxID=45428 RepID=A0A9P7YGI3_9HELO|nr:hypothetical protein BJ875DRAFT_72715 [Amylocarpus encephaloides]